LRRRQGVSLDVLDPAELQRRIDETASRLKSASERARAVTGRAESADGLLKVLVDSQGRLSDITLDPRVRRNFGAAELGAAITSVTRSAAADAATQVGAIWAEVYPDAEPYPGHLSKEA
jgi:DNA-binding protein YbaB